MIDERIARFALRKSKGISYRESGTGPALVCLHGIGAASAGWLPQLETLKGYRLIAWDAPGYGESDFLPAEKPGPADYAQALHEFLERLLLKDVVLVANSLGCLMATAYAAAHPERVRSMILLGPAGGYGDWPAAEREAKLTERLAQIDTLGPEGMAATRAPTLVAKTSPPIALEITRWTHAHLRAPGYRQALHCLAQGHLAADARRYGKKVLVACGSEDAITPESACKKIAAAFTRGQYLTLPGVGHVPHMEAAEEINELIAAFVAR
ncbi:MAG: alpha/beta fold hydrolase [Burkholderiales bacterium]